ncbi:MAG: hypothetical protein NT118_09645, partial [Lentisphaerae bacterium]|nr:hypothetical protein [Lentisphaerota bacterium]
NGNFLDIYNEKIQVWLTADQKQSGKIRKLRIIGSPVSNQLTERNTGVSWAGFNLGEQAIGETPIEISEKPVIKVSGPLKKMVEYSTKDFLIQYSVYSFSPRVDIRLISKGAETVKTVTKWVAGGDDAYDMFYYEGGNGPLQLKAGPDFMSDKNDVYPNLELTKWMKEGWAALSDGKANETVGCFFDRGAITYFNYYSQTINGGETFSINFKLKDPVTVALSAIKGNSDLFRAAYIEWKNPPIISLGSAQAYENITGKPPKVLSGFTRGYMFADDRDGMRFTDDFADHLVGNIRALGGNYAKFVLRNLSVFPLSVPLSEKEYEDYGKIYKKYYNAEWTPIKFGKYDTDIPAANSYLCKLIEAAHRKGVAVSNWLFFCPFIYGREGYIRDAEFQDCMVDLYKRMASCNIDMLNIPVGREGAYVPPEAEGAPVFLLGKADADAWFKYQKPYVELAERMRRELKKINPDVTLNTLCSFDGVVDREMFMDEKAPFLDTGEIELCPGMTPDMPRLKYGVKKMHGVFGNDGRSIQHHFYITGDFYRLTDYTGLGNFIAGAIPYKFMAVFRDSDAFKDDIRNKKTSFAFSAEMGEQDARCKQLAVIKNIPLDVIFNRFFKAEELRKYKLIFIPSDRVFSNECEKELEKYVQDGGCVISEGNTVDNNLFAKFAGVKKVNDNSVKADISGIPMKASVSVTAEGAEVLTSDSKGSPAIFIIARGKGKVIYSPYILTDDIINSREKEFFIRGLITKLAGAGPVIPAENNQIPFDSSLLVNGNEYFLGVYNSSTKPLLTELKLDIPKAANFFLLNVKTGKRTPFTGAFKTDIDPLQTGFYIIGSDKTTEIPELQKAVLNGGSSSSAGMKFREIMSDSFSFEFTPDGKPKTLGILHITDTGGPASQAYGAEAIFNSLKNALQNVNVKYLENLEEKTINGCDAVIVPNMGIDMPSQLKRNWPDILAMFARQGGGVMVIHHAIGVGDVGAPPFPSIGKWSGNYYAVNDFSVSKEHPVTEGMKIDEVFHDNCWDYDQVEPGEDGKVLALGLRKDGIPTPALVAGKVGKGNVIVSGIGIGSGGKMENGKYVKFEADPEGGIKKILMNSVKWMLSKETLP